MLAEKHAATVVSRVDPTTLPVSLPQFSAASRERMVESDTSREWDLAGERRRIEESVVRTAMRVCGMQEVEHCKVYEIDKGSSKLAHIRNVLGFTVADGRVEPSQKNSAHEIVTVILAKAPGRQGPVVPLVIPHEHPRNFGEKLKQAVYREYQDVYGKTPPEMARSRFAVMYEGLMVWARANEREMRTALVGASVLMAGLFARTPSIRWLSENLGEGLANIAIRGQLVEKQEKEAAEKMRQTIGAVNEKALTELEAAHAAFESKALKAESFFKMVTKAHFEAVNSTLDDAQSSPARKVQALKLLNTLAAVQQETKRVFSLGFNYAVDISYYRPRLQHIVAEAQQPEVRHAAADLLARNFNEWSKEESRVLNYEKKHSSSSGNFSKLHKWREAMRAALVELKSLCDGHQNGSISAQSLMAVMEEVHYDALIYNLISENVEASERPQALEIFKTVAEAHYNTGVIKSAGWHGRVDRNFIRNQLFMALERAYSPELRHAEADAIFRINNMWRGIAHGESDLEGARAPEWRPSCAEIAACSELNNK